MSPIAPLGFMTIRNYIRRRVFLVLAVWAPSWLLLLAGEVGFYVAMCSLCASTAYAAYGIRCPRCNENLAQPAGLSMLPTFPEKECPHCGVSFSEIR